MLQLTHSNYILKEGEDDNDSKCINFIMLVLYTLLYRYTEADPGWDDTECGRIVSAHATNTT